ncbi:unnamed protein product [Cochlearia groenlandica]
MTTASTLDPTTEQTQTHQAPYALPPYPQMIMEAIEASNDVNGCSKTAIADYIDSTQITLPPSHATLLNYHLNQMKLSGHLVMVKNNFAKPDPNGPPKRGRGRPPKAKPLVDTSNVTTVPAPSVLPARPRGRPPKAKDLSEVSSSSAIQEKPEGERRGRGRPPKRKTADSERVEAEDAPAVKPDGERRGRGRPPKAKPVMVLC